MRAMELNLGLSIVGSANFLPPDKAFTNLEILRRHPEFQGQSETRLNIFARRIQQEFGFGTRNLVHFPGTPIDPHELTSEDLAKSALQKAFAATPLLQPDQKFQPDVLIHGTTTTSRYTGSQATALAGAMGWSIPSYETRTGCATSLGVLHLGWILMQAGFSRLALSVGETLSKVINPLYRDDWFGMGDGASCLLLEKKQDHPQLRVRRSVFWTQGQFADLYTTPATLPPHQSGLSEGRYFLHGDPLQLREQAKKGYLEMLELLLPSPADRQSLRWIVPHQVNLGLVKEVVQDGKLAGEILWSAQEIGNIGGSSVMYTFVDHWQKGTFQKGDRILLMSVGGGLSIAGQLWTVE